ncbi:hypothetical protein HaLaN_11736 [Haematococcus lacustris]|uniref:Uncharacterized protein n=1 Tax=Haematococcus lacustris TaxID=44745 RepID=A0A699Z8R0_HAELA|nr:hypothetical protein HaLaN_11736 [Haematococcus lacustris]
MKHVSLLAVGHPAAVDLKELVSAVEELPFLSSSSQCQW